MWAPLQCNLFVSREADVAFALYLVGELAFLGVWSRSAEPDA